MAAPAALWETEDITPWSNALDTYPRVIDAQGVPQLAALDVWYHDELPGVFAQRRLVHLTLPELIRITEWKMHRGVWRAPNLVRVRRNDPELVIETTVRAFSRCPHPTQPIGEIAKLDGVGPATASAVVAAQVPALGEVKWTLGYYAKYAEQLRERAARLGASWTPVMVERALWSHVGGKARLVPSGPQAQ